MIIGIDARPLNQKKTGIGYYLQYLLENILENDKENQYILFSDREIFFNNKKYSNIKLVIEKKSKLKKTFWYMICLDKLCKKYEVDVFWGTQHVLPFGLKNIKTVLTIHDLVAFDFKETMSFYNRVINRILIPYSIKKADKIIAVSKSTKERILSIFSDKYDNKISVIYEDVIVNKNKSEFTDEYLNDKGLKKKQYILFVGTIEPRKNLITLMNSMEKIYNFTGMKLVICGKLGWKCQNEVRIINQNKDKIVYFDYITDDEKNYLMKNCFVFVFPSLYEGFGLPVLEAMRNNAVVLVADNTSLKEIVDNKLLTFETLNKEMLSEKIISLYENKQLYYEALEYCQKREKNFDWKNISVEYINKFLVWENSKM